MAKLSVVLAGSGDAGLVVTLVTDSRLLALDVVSVVIMIGDLVADAYKSQKNEELGRSTLNRPLVGWGSC